MIDESLPIIDVGGEEEPITPEKADLDLIPPAPRTLTPTEIRRVGAMQVGEIRDTLLEQFCADQAKIYHDLPKEKLIDLLVERDRVLALEGRALASGKIQGRILREFVRGVLSYADHADLRAVDRKGLQLSDSSKTATIENLLRALGAEPADNRQLKIHGTTLGGELGDDEERQALTDINLGDK